MRWLAGAVLAVAAASGVVSAAGLLRVGPAGSGADVVVRSGGPGEEGRFELTFTQRAGGISSWYDLDRDPQREHNLAGRGGLPNVALLTHTLIPVGARASEVLYGAPATKITVLEDNPVRVRIRLEGSYRELRQARNFQPGGGQGQQPFPRRGGPRIPFQTTYTIYPTGQIYLSHRILSPAATLRLAQSQWVLSVAPTSQFRVVGSAGAGRPPARTDFVLHSSAGPVFFADVLLVPWRGGRPVGRWGERFMVGAEGRGATRSALQAHPPGAQLGPQAPAQRYLLQIEPDWMDGAGLAQIVAEAYQRPPTPVMAPGGGELLRGEQGDDNLDGFSEAQGCYLVRGTRAGSRFSLELSESLLMRPVFRISGWQASPPASILVNKRRWSRGQDFQAVLLDESTLLVQLYRNLTGGRVELEFLTGTAPRR